MKIEFRVEITREAAHRIGFVLTTAVVLGAAAAVHADQVRFSSGETLKASDLNANFDELYAGMNRPVASANGQSISVNGLYCGTTEGHTGALGGYTAAKALCEAACDSPTAHMCTIEEAVRSQVLGVTWEGEHWVATGLRVEMGNVTAWDCYGWLQANGAGYAWSVADGHARAANCANTLGALCCD
jgi:hypothetical protein